MRVNRASMILGVASGIFQGLCYGVYSYLKNWQCLLAIWCLSVQLHLAMNVNRASTEHQQSVNSASTECQQSLNRVSTEPQQSLNRASTERQQSVNRVSTERQQSINRAPTEHQHSVNRVSTECKQFWALHLE